MNLRARVRSWLRVVLGRARAESEMDAELRFHIDSRTDDLIRSGLSRQEALRRARIEFGGVESVKEECRDANHSNFFDSVLNDIRFALRMLRKSPGFTAIAILTLALGIGANTAIFSVVYSVLLRPFPFPQPAQLVSIFENNLEKGIPITGCSYPDLLRLQSQTRQFSEIAGAQRHDLTLTGKGEPAVVHTIVVTPGVFTLLGRQPLLGRFLLPEDNRKGAAPAVVLSENLWRSRFASDPAILGASVTLDQRAYIVAGVMPASFRVPVYGEHQQIWIPLAQDPLFGPWMDRRGGHWLRVLGRMKPGVSFAQAQAELDAASSALAAEFPAENDGWSIRLSPLQKLVVSDVRTPLLVLLAAVGLVLLIACVNIANLLLARATTRVREVALRQALGAGRFRIVRQLLTESLVLGLVGSALGILLAVWGVQALVAFLPPEIPQFGGIHADFWVLGFALLLSVTASAGFGLAPALLASNSSTNSALREGAERTGEGASRLRLRSFLAASEIALAVVLVVGAGLLIRSFIRMTSVAPGFGSEHIVKAQVSLPQYQYSAPHQWRAFASTLLERLQSQPGMSESAIGAPLPIADGVVNLGFSIEGAPPPPGLPTSADYATVSPEYFGVLGIPLLRGRLLGRTDSPGSALVTVISQSFARAYFPNENPVGHRINFSFPPDSAVPHEIVGVVGDVRDVSLRQPPGPMMYVPFAQAPLWGADVLVKSPLPESSVVAAIHQSVRSIDSNLPVTDVASMNDVLADSVAASRVRAWLLGLFGSVALLLAAAGVFGVISYSVSRRTREFGVRVALGAAPADIRGMVLRETFRLAASGLAAGLIAAFALSHFLASQLYAVGARDPLTFAIAILVLLAAAVLAGYLPARRATRIDPVAALRCD